METCPVCALDELLYPLECCSHKLCLKCLKGVCIHASACPCCRAEFSIAFKTRIGKAPATIRDIGTDINDRIEAMFAAGVAWAYNDRKNKGCWLYDEHTQREIKSVKDAGVTTTLDATACGCVVTIDLEHLTQVNKSTFAIRRIRVLSSDNTDTIKGIAGMPRARQTLQVNISQHPEPRAATESLTAYRARIRAAFVCSGQPLRRDDENKVAFNRRIRTWAATKM